MTTATDTKLSDHVQYIADKLTHGFADETNDDGEPLSAYDYLQDALDIEYIVSSKKEYLGARVLVAFGGPNIWVNTRTNTIEGHWWGDKATASFEDGIGLDDALQDLYLC
jgi:hypothetical protein